MKILLINDFDFKNGGAEHVMFETEKLLKSQGHEVLIIGSKRLSRLTPLLSGWFSIKFYFQVQKIIKQFNPDIVHVHGCIRLISPSPLLAAKLKKTPVIMTVHDFELISLDAALVVKKYMFIRKIKLTWQRLIIKKTVDYYICPSKELTLWLKKSFATNNVEYIPNFSSITYKLVKNSKKTKSNYFIFVGRLYKEKGVVILIKAMNMIVNNYKLKNIRLKIIGNGPQYNYLIKLTQKYKITNNVEFLGEIPNTKLVNFYKESISLVVPSVWRENSPLNVYEAMSVGIPIIATNIGGIPDLVENNKNGYLFDIGDYQKLAKLMKKLYENIFLRTKMGEYGYIKNKFQFNKKLYYKSILKIYNNYYKNK